CDRTDFSIFLNCCDPPCQHIHRTFGHNRISIFQIMKGGHQFSVTVERQLTQAGIGIPHSLCRHTQLVRQVNHGCLCGVSDLFAVHIRGVVAQNTQSHHLLVQRIHRICLVCVHILAIHEIMFHSHLI